MGVSHFFYRDADGNGSWQFSNKASNSTSAADAMMLRSILHTTYTMPFSVGSKLAGSCGDGGLSRGNLGVG